MTCLFIQRLGLNPLQLTSMDCIARSVAASHGLTLADLRGPSQTRRVSIPRQEAMAKCYELGKSNRQVAHFFHREDHTTVVHARHRYAQRIAEGSI